MKWLRSEGKEGWGWDRMGRWVGWGGLRGERRVVLGEGVGAVVKELVVWMGGGGLDGTRGMVEMVDEMVGGVEVGGG
ncbi:hypothetical protein, partial [Kocuria rhizophila]|uniref:hypothetical protein n=1 Tax=Kocuria rhizophila TaxID=72000 RepID=UPI001642D102